MLTDIPRLDGPSYETFEPCNSALHCICKPTVIPGHIVARVANKLDSSMIPNALPTSTVLQTRAGISCECVPCLYADP